MNPERTILRIATPQGTNIHIERWYIDDIDILANGELIVKKDDDVITMLAPGRWTCLYWVNEAGKPVNLTFDPVRDFEPGLAK